MFDIFRKKRQPEQVLPKVDPRDLLFGHAPMSAWPGSVSSEQREPWTSFVKARGQASTGNTAAATKILHDILEMPNLESRHYLQAWHFLKQMGEQPAGDEAKRLYGVVVEVGMSMVSTFSRLTSMAQHVTLTTREPE